MLAIRKAQARGHAHHGWLESFHTFSFANYHDPAQMGFRDLRVINEDHVAPGRGFGTHPHRDMEILTWVLAGALRHEDSLGTGSVIRPGDLQRMSAGTGVTHSEINASATEPVHLLQTWIFPEREDTPPSYEQKHFPADARRGALQLVASREGRDGSVRLKQDVDLYTALLDGGAHAEHRLRPGRHAWLQLARGSCTLNGVALEAGDGVALSDEPALQFTAARGAEVLLFDLA